MKKSLILLAASILAVSCDLPAGGNKGRIVKTDEVVRYDDPNAPKGTYTPTADSAKVDHLTTVAADSSKTVVAPEVKAVPETTAPAAEHK